MQTKTKTTLKPIIDVNNLEGTILDPSKARKTLMISLPAGTFENVTVIKLPPALRVLKTAEDGTPIISDLQRAADRVVQALVALREEKSTENELRLKESVGVYVRNVHRQLSWKFEDLVNSRDTTTTSSAYLVGVPAFRFDIFVDGKDCDLEPWEVALHPKTASNLGLAHLDLALLERFPKTACRVVRVVTDPTLGRDVIGLPTAHFNVGDYEDFTLAKLLGGDCDGDCYTLRAFHSRKHKLELKRVFESQWIGAHRIDYTAPVYTWRDEKFSTATDQEIAESKFDQKVVIGPVTNTCIQIFVVKMMAKHTLKLTFGELRFMMERAIETAMDMKKVQGDDPLAFRNVVLGERPFDESAIEELTKQGFNCMHVHTLLQFISEHGGDIRALAMKNPAYAVLMSEKDAVERFLATSPEHITRHFLNELYAHRFAKPGKKPYHAKLTRPKGRYGKCFFAATFDVRTKEIVVDCGLGETRIATSAGGRAIRLSQVEVALFRPTVQVDFLVRGGKLSTNCTLHHGWPSVINALARSEYAWEIWEIIATPEKEIADRDLERLVKKILRRMLKAYELDGGNIASWNAVCGVHKYVVLETELPVIDGLDFITLEHTRRLAAAKFLMERKLINHMSDTISGDPGMAFYAKVGDGITAATASDPLNSLAALKRAPVRNALSNVVDILGAKEESFSRKFKHNPPMVELATIAMPIDGMDAMIASDTISADLTAMLPVVDTEMGESRKFYEATDGTKIQARVDVKGVTRQIPEEKLPWIRFADGSMVRAQVVISMCSKSHEMLRHTHCTLALTAAAKRMVETTGHTMSVPAGVTAERVARVAQISGLYSDADMLVEVLHPETMELIGMFPGGYCAFGVHRQIPEIVASIHQQRDTRSFFPTSIADGGVVSGIAGDFCMLAEGLVKCQGELHGVINKALNAEIRALASGIIRK